ncbi:MAG: hypothetical protein VX938_07850, partial [Myxococcota bacterium]|nr:hypothetical protein [Myxococcota bacterium]
MGTALNGLEAGDVWVSAGANREGVSGSERTDRVGGAQPSERDGLGGGVWWWPYFMGLLLGVGPLALGLALGLWTRAIPAISSRRRWLLPLVFLVALPVALVVSVVFPALSTWDIVWVFSWMLGGWALGLQETFGGRELGLLLASLCLSLLVAEGVARMALDTAPSFPPPREARLAFSPEEREEACRQLYPDRFQGGIVSDLLVRQAQSVVLHVGDSMVYGTSVARGETFTARLDKADPVTGHWNAGQPGTGTDYHAVLLETLLPRASVNHVVLYVYPGNDLVDLDKPYACCQHGPLLDETEPRPVWRCPQPGWAFPLQALLARSPPPYA